MGKLEFPNPSSFSSSNLYHSKCCNATMADGDSGNAGKMMYAEIALHNGKWLENFRMTETPGPGPCKCHLMDQRLVYPYI